MKEIFDILFNISLLVFVIGSMVTLGLGLTVSQIFEPFKKVKLVLFALLANFVIVPLFALCLVWALPVSEGLRIGILLLSVGGGAPFIPKVVEVAKGNVAGAVGLMLLLLIVTMFFMPIVVPMLFSGASVSSWQIAQSLIFTMLAPLILALVFKARFSDIAALIQPYTSKVTNISVLVMVIAVVIADAKVIVSHASALPIIFIFLLGTISIGYAAGGKNRNARIIFAIGTGLRNPPIAILVANQHFSAEPMAAITPLLAAIVGLLLLVPSASKIGKKYCNT